MRADAARRRAAIVDAGRTLFAERGGDVALEAVAEAAGVGIATLYRNFDSRAALLDEVALAILADVAAVVDEALGGLEGGVVSAWEDCLRRLVDLDLGALTAALADHVGGALSPSVREAQDRTLARVEALLAAARARDLVRADLSALDLVVAIGMVTRPQPEAVLRVAPGLQARLVSILLAGLRPEPGSAR